MKTVITDLDGTILVNGKLTEKAVHILNEFQKENRLVLATGRNLKSVEDISQQLNIDKNNGALILLNGLAFYDYKDHEYIMRDSFHKKEAKRIYRICYLLFFRVTVVGRDERVRFNDIYNYIYQTLRYLIKHKPREIDKTKKEFPEHIEKIEIGGTIFLEFFYRILKRVLKEYEVVRVSKYWIEILPKGTNKVHQVQYFVNKYHIVKDDLYIFGDGENDMEMLKYAYHSYSPDNALEEVKEVAHFQCQSVYDDGVIDVIQNLMDP